MKIKFNANNNLKTIEDTFEEFQQFNKIKDLSECTITSYQASYRIFAEYYDEQNLCNSLNIKITNGFIGHLKDKRKVNNISINSHLRNMRAFINYCIRLGYIEEFKIPTLKAEKELKETYTDSELTILLKRPDIKQNIGIGYLLITC